MKKAVTLLLCVVLIFGVMTPAVSAAADKGVSQPNYFRIGTFTIDFYIEDSGKSTCYCRVATDESTDYIELTMELQRKEDNEWNTIKTWTGSDTHVAYLNKNWYVLSGYQYQLKITAKVYDSSGKLRETQVEYSYRDSH